MTSTPRKPVLASESPHTGLKAPAFLDQPSMVANDRSLVKSSGPGSESADTRAQTSLAHGTLPPPEGVHGLALVQAALMAFMYCCLRFLLGSLVFEKTSQQSNPERPASPQPESSRVVIHTSLGDENDNCGNVRGSGKTTITVNMGSIPEGGLPDLGTSASFLPEMTTSAGRRNKNSALIEDSGGTYITYNIGTKASAGSPGKT